MFKNRRISRRGFLSAGLLGGLGLVSVATLPYTNDTTTRLVLNEITIPHPLLPKSFEEFRIAVISDLHLGVFVPDELILEAVKQIKESSPDLILLAGDYLGIPDSYPALLFSDFRNSKFQGKKSSSLIEKIYQQLLLLLSSLKAPHGVYATLGNHDHWNDSRIFLKTFADSNITTLVNEMVVLRRSSDQIKLFGFDDFWTGIPRFDKSFTDPNDDTFRIAISHNPDLLGHSLLKNFNNFDLGICGHTHGGQIILPLVGAPYGYNVRYPQFATGLTVHNESYIYTSKGIGVVEIPYRVNCMPEVSLLTLKVGELISANRA